MKTSTKKLLKWTGIVFVFLLLVVIGFGVYLYSILPPTIGQPIVLQKELFAKPEKPFPMEGKFIYKSATELAEMIKNKKATSVEIVTEFINHIKNNNYRYNSLIYLREQEALAEAKQADDLVAKGNTSKPLLGVPITIKEMFWVKGSPSTMNAKMFGVTATSDAPIVTQLKNAGGIVLGTTNVPFMLADYQTYGEVYPTANNPYDVSRTPGGSTGGGASALAAGFTSIELGSDMGGSIRVPAVFCGLWSLKTSFGTVNITEGTSPDPSIKFTRFAMASPGPLARTPEDLELTWNIIRETKIDARFQKPIQWNLPSDKKLKDYKFAWMDEWKTEVSNIKIGEDSKEKLKNLVDSLNQQGAVTDKNAPDTYIPMTKLFLSSFISMMSQGQPWLIQKFIERDMKNMGNNSKVFESFRDTTMDGSDQSWEKVEAERKELIAKWEDFFKQYDFFVCPLSYSGAFHHSERGNPIIADDGTMVAYVDYVPYAYIFNATGHPAITVPMGLNKQGLPIGIQIVGKLNSEPELLHLAKLLKPITPGFVKPQ